MRMGRFRIALVSGLGIALLAAVGIIIHQSRRLAEFERQRNVNLQSLRQTWQALRQSELQSAAVAAKSKASANEDQAAIAQRDATIEQLNTEINQAHTSIAGLRRQLARTREEDQRALAGANERYEKMQANWQSRLDALQRELTAVQADLQDARRRITAVEAANAKLRSENTVHAARTAEREQLLASLQDLDRRREAYLSSIADRYRDVTNRFRTMSGMLDSNRQQSSGGFSGAALDLIQNTISLAEDDLRHLNELNAKAFQLQRELAKK